MSIEKTLLLPPRAFSRLTTTHKQCNIHLSSTMHDIDLAVEEGLAAPALPAAQEREAELANLELLIARVADQACTNSDGGGALGRMREFNAFLERAAAVLEGR